MGAFNSIHDKLKEFSEAEDDMNQEHTTPQRVLKHKFLAGFDPRSPTQEIDRTPIVFEGTPSVVSTNNKYLRSRIPCPSQDGGPADPRSPSADFTRTPLSLGRGSSSDGSCETPLKATTTVHLPQKLKGDDFTASPSDKVSAESLSDASDEDDPSSEDSDQNAVSTTEDSLLESYDTAPLLEGTDKLSLSSSVHDAQKGGFSSGQDIETDDSFSTQRKPKCRPVNRILSHTNSVPKDKGRSPLTQVENSSRVSRLPRKVVPSSMGKKNYSVINNSVAVDKENACH